MPPCINKIIPSPIIAENVPFVAPLQDVLSLGAAGRMNLPGAVGSPNWEWRLDSWPETARQLKALRPAILARQGIKVAIVALAAAKGNVYV